MTHTSLSPNFTRSYVQLLGFLPRPSTNILSVFQDLDVVGVVEGSVGGRMSQGDSGSVAEKHLSWKLVSGGAGKKCRINYTYPVSSKVRAGMRLH